MVVGLNKSPLCARLARHRIGVRHDTPRSRSDRRCGSGARPVLAGGYVGGLACGIIKELVTGKGQQCGNYYDYGN